MNTFAIIVVGLFLGAILFATYKVFEKIWNCDED